MRRFRGVFWTVPLVSCMLAGGATVAGCKGEASLKVATPEPPPPPPPPPDTDGDGIIDPDDKCVSEKEDGNPPDPKDGCPNKDMDNDGIPIPQDVCPDKPETVNDYQDDDGCPDEKPIVELKEKEVKINQQIMFKKNSAAIEPESMPIIEAVAKVLKDNPEVQLTEVGGHASKEGDKDYNRQLTQKRVDSVMKALIDQGVEKERLVAQGYGFYCPIDPGDTEDAFVKNRRVEFKILYRKGQDLQQVRGCDEATKAGIKLKALPPLKPWTDADQKKQDATGAGSTGAAGTTGGAMGGGAPPSMGSGAASKGMGTSPTAPATTAAPTSTAPAPK